MSFRGGGRRTLRRRRRPRLTVSMFCRLILKKLTFWPLMTVSLIGKSLNGYSKFLLSKVTKKFWISHSFFFVSIFGRVYTDFFNRVKCAVTAVDSGRRALQFLGLDEEKTSSVGFDVRMNYIFKQFSVYFMYIWVS